MSDPRWRDLGVRLASALVLAPLGLAAIWYGGWVWGLCLGLVVAGLMVEWVALCGARGWMRAGGQLYIAIAGLALLALRGGPGGFGRVLFMMLVVWSADIGAYLVGRLLGGPRLAPRISPGKTWSGAAGGTICAMLAGVMVADWLGLGGTGAALGLALLLSVVAQAGDLLESAAKRHVGAKDSGWIIPGHGGLLDRLDGVLAAAPVAWLVAAIFHVGWMRLPGGAGF